MNPAITELENRAAAASGRGDTASTERLCRQILSLDGNHLSSLRFLADLALQRGDFNEAEAHLRAFTRGSPGDVQALSQLAQALYRQGRLEAALDSYRQLLRIEPRRALLYLTIGCLYLELGDSDRAAQVFSLGEAVDPNLLSLWQRRETDPAIARMSRTAREALCRHHTALHVEAVDSLGEAAGTRRIRDALWPLLDTRPVEYDHPLHRPQVFYIPGLQSTGFFDTEALPWRAQLESSFADIAAEITAGLDLEADGRPYLGNGHRLEGAQWEPLVNKKSWTSVHLYSRGTPNAAVLGKFPRTLAALEQVPLATRRGTPGEVFVSVLAPRTTIPAHYGVSSAILTAHLPVVVPPGCGLQVHDETRVPQEGKLMVFDDTWQHSAWNHSDRQRVVLIFELWHPGLSELEQRAIDRSFEAREHWLRRRSVE